MAGLLQQPGYEEERLQRISELLPCREVQAGLLLSLMGQPQQYCYPSIFIFGHRSSGKSHVLNVLLKELELPHATVSCVECVSATLLFEEVLLSFFGSDAASLLPRSPSLSDFVRVYRLHRSQFPAKQTRYVIMEKAELLRDAEANLLPALLRFQELVEDNVAVILLSEIVWDTFRPNTGCFEPLLLHFPDYSKGELQQILSRDRHPSYSAEFYSSYINILLGVFYSVCRDLRELRHLAALNFPKFCEPLEAGKVKETDTHKLWKNIEPHLKKAMQTVYLREVSSLQWEQMQQVEEHEAGALRGLSAHTHVELPYYSKFLLIAAYLASYNPARTDKRFFLKHHGKIKKTNFLKKNEKTSNHLLGPKPFPLDRLLAIFYSVVDSRVAPTASIFSQISSLVTLQLLVQVSHDDQLDAPKYKCAVSLDFITAVSRTVNFEIVKYLYDFL
ncbi:origin recognition complex subunit 5 isoform X1 [Kryptolebias marmoratus]|uniref:Origin recognition complex subunit 5 n=1 Tax=Kryptolebias marmoratus TaxID=37003 RepID=A0A3Q3AEZ1_KRYMA|nr:origin recognition complex subunit 5 isoform X1 [Kryptolebias marmoratus]XP_017267200.1 origin recognition complex subunit 5 isoform X1 [Kryptolebias marmoratus]XP_024860749.1 origin recognition complex subunit 5 isoform X1 [Kryptolebias marmoratus]